MGEETGVTHGQPQRQVSASWAGAAALRAAPKRGICPHKCADCQRPAGRVGPGGWGRGQGLQAVRGGRPRRPAVVH